MSAASDKKPSVIELCRVSPQSSSIPLSESDIAAGFPSPAEDHKEVELDLNRYLISNPAATFFARVKGNSMVGAGIHDGDLLIIDRSLEWRAGRVAVCFIDGEFTVKFLAKERDGFYLLSANSDFKPIKVNEEDDFRIWGVVSYVIHKPG